MYNRPADSDTVYPQSWHRFSRTIIYTLSRLQQDSILKCAKPLLAVVLKRKAAKEGLVNITQAANRRSLTKLPHHAIEDVASIYVNEAGFVDKQVAVYN